MLSGIPAATIWRKNRSTPARNVQRNPHSSPSMMDGNPPTDVDLRDLNASLVALAAIFPDIRAEVFREMLSSFSEVSRLQLVTESLLKHKAKWVRGRWHVPHPHTNGTPIKPEGRALALRDQFRSSGYKAAVKSAFYQEFKGLSHSTIKAVLAEHNYSYADTRAVLLSLASTSWRFSLTNVILRRKAPTADLHPFLEWRPSSSGTLEPVLVRINNAELAKEIEDTVLAPLLHGQVTKQIQRDLEVARGLNESEAEQQGSLFDCECCFSSNAFEDITACDHGHYMCFACVRHTMSEAVYGQGWGKSVDVDRATLKCIALTQGNEGQCEGCISRSFVQTICNLETTGRDSWRKFGERLALDCLNRSNLPLLRCPFCVYAEYEDMKLPSNQEQHQWNVFIVSCISIVSASLILHFLGIDPFEFLATCLLTLLSIVVYKRKLLVPLLSSPSQEATQHAHHGRKFNCRNPDCSRISCVRCSAPWTDIHVCYQSSRQALRTYVESAVTEAIKRTCPQCNLAFVKSSGCNKLVCVCGYTMCYVCRADIGTEGYKHFCQHFRPDPGRGCEECERCDLYRVEDEEIVIKRAKDIAVREWKEQEAGNGNARKEVGEGWNAEKEADGVGNAVASWRKGGFLRT